MDDVRSGALKLALRLSARDERRIGLMPAEGGLDRDMWLVDAGIALAEAFADVSGTTACFVDFTGRHLGEPRTETRAHCDVIVGGGGVGQLRAQLPQLAAYKFVVVDLSGYKARGEHLEAVALLDGVLQFVRLGLTEEAAVLRHRLEFPTSANLGVVTVA